MKYQEYKKLSEDEKCFWQFEQLAEIKPLKERVFGMDKRINFIYYWATGVAAGVSFVFMIVKNRFFDN